MRRIALLAVVLAATGCASRPTEHEDVAASPRQVPPWLDGVYSDGTVEFRYPGGWKRGSSRTFGALVSDNVSARPAFVSVRYFDDEVPLADAVVFVGRTIRPRARRGLTLLHAQTALIGGRRGREAAFVWATRESSPLGPKMRTFLVPLRDGRTALLILAADQPELHAGVFRWIRETVRWTQERQRPFRQPGGRVPNEAMTPPPAEAALRIAPRRSGAGEAVSRSRPVPEGTRRRGHD